MHVLERLPGLAARGRELTAERTDHQLVEDVQQSLVRATNLSPANSIHDTEPDRTDFAGADPAH